jgi:hypothetical protein
VTYRTSPSAVSSSTVKARGSGSTPSASDSETPRLAMLASFFFVSNSGLTLLLYVYYAYLAGGYSLPIKAHSNPASSPKRRPVLAAAPIRITGASSAFSASVVTSAAVNANLYFVLRLANILAGIAGDPPKALGVFEDCAADLNAAEGGLGAWPAVSISCCQRAIFQWIAWDYPYPRAIGERGLYRIGSASARHGRGFLRSPNVRCHARGSTSRASNVQTLPPCTMRSMSTPYTEGPEWRPPLSCSQVRSLRQLRRP